ncbi:MAG: TIM barrel protein [Pseudotabrizicola sp.]|uniref:sugar phosphate isomerase/epimerase family protein n=1 Tax=Pseudotabrizicola sp. TaxID=2939647 RepID=UPI0027305FD6|nr:TIM barrel protein [Pseudotabrizicola sp.]MDP2080510.1 TIM barrel protein [Pseudotabrizicola sp.]MDZ7575236.1 TIM barrel protein [Pseudotabrizicola sp.]
MTIYSLAHLTALDQSPPQLVRLASRLGYDRVGLRLIRVTDTSEGYALHTDPALLRQTRQALADTGVSVNDIEFVRLTPDFDPQALRALLETGAALGARHVICAPYDPDLNRLAANLAAFQENALGFGLSCVLEFFPWTVVPDLASANGVIDATGSTSLGILLDTLHFNRSGSTLAELDKTPHQRFPFVHLGDAPVHPPYSMEELLHTGRAERLPPGDGQIDLAAILNRLPRDTPLSLEVPMTGLQTMRGSEAVAELAITAAKRVTTNLRRHPES